MASPVAVLASLAEDAGIEPAKASPDGTAGNSTRNAAHILAGIGCLQLPANITGHLWELNPVL
jgi:hypothetical protein